MLVQTNQTESEPHKQQKSSRHHHSKSYKILREEIKEVRKDLVNLTTMVRQMGDTFTVQHHLMGQQLNEIKMMIHHLCEEPHNDDDPPQTDAQGPPQTHQETHNEQPAGTISEQSKTINDQDSISELMDTSINEPNVNEQLIPQTANEILELVVGTSIEVFSVRVHFNSRMSIERMPLKLRYDYCMNKPERRKRKKTQPSSHLSVSKRGRSLQLSPNILNPNLLSPILSHIQKQFNLIHLQNLLSPKKKLNHL
ncbi:uncharacterized protein LOC120082892 [Benincasa hispida]|uniref:uncharacterized protein LOC120082892 n=1 Tax=Benincasa hispida TaxID=102211 RepID=UPI001900F7EB|nr:uncharacterized protein LOC120082892 [Benincasa hispida]